MNILDVLADASQYQIASKTGAIVAGTATKIIFYARNTSTTRLALIQHVEIDGHYTTTAYGVGLVLYELFFARAFTAENGTPNRVALTITGANQRLKTSWPKTAMGVIRINDTTQGGLGTPTWTLDSQPIGQLAGHSSAGYGVAAPIIGNQLLPNDGVLFHANVRDGECPIILGTNEGIGIQVTTATTGVGVHGVTMKWAETDRFSL